MTPKLDELVVRNLGVLSDVAIEPADGLTVVTGETGAGKTLLVGALSALLGQGLDQGRIGPASEEVDLSARFVGGEGEVVARARLTRGGRTRSYLDGAITPAADLANRLGDLVEVVAQHDGLRLRREQPVRSMLDAALDGKGLADLIAYREAWSSLRETEEAIAALGDDERGLRRELDVARLEAAEIDAATLVDGEVEDLQATVERLRNLDEIVETTAAAGEALEQADEALGRAVDALRRLDGYDPTALLGEGAERGAVEVTEVQAALRRYREELAHDPEGLELAQARLARIGELRRRYGADVADIRAYGERAGARAAEIAELLERAGSLEAEREERRKAAVAAGVRLASARRGAGEALAGAAVAELTDLGFADPLLEFTVEESEPGPQGCDSVALLFASDRRLDPAPVAAAASGGELSRIVLALRLAAGVADVPVVVFDEVDAGVGGATALALGKKLAAVAETAQVLCVTHLPQIAAHADRHLVVARNGARADVVVVEGEARVAELTRMLSGLSESDQGRSHARELLAEAGWAG